MERCVGPVKQALADAKITERDIDEVILVGGATRMPAVQALVRRLTGGKEPNQSVNPDEVVAVGAAIQAGVLAGEVKGVVLLDVTPLSMGIETLGGVMTKIDRAKHDHTRAQVRNFLDGRREPDRGRCPRAAGRARTGARQPHPRQFPAGRHTARASRRSSSRGYVRYRRQRHPTVTAKDKDTGKEQKITISGSTQLSKEEIDRMVKDAEAHADEDRRRREEIEVRNQADSVAYQVERQLRELGDRAPANEKARAEQLIGEIRDAIKSPRPTSPVCAK